MQEQPPGEIYVIAIAGLGALVYHSLGLFFKHDQEYPFSATNVSRMDVILDAEQEYVNFFCYKCTTSLNETMCHCVHPVCLVKVWSGFFVFLCMLCRLEHLSCTAFHYFHSLCYGVIQMPLTGLLKKRLM